MRGVFVRACADRPLNPIGVAGFCEGHDEGARQVRSRPGGRVELGHERGATSGHRFVELPQGPISFQRIFGLEVEDGGLFPVVKPLVAWDPGIVR